ncbi:hypothetical protein Nepgr_007283 [Nepenthes gracilis]|uniref:Pentatricopeptide repeat-containing protein n=1 Tax=Nepenthes gracilis TaxID=150966 RepID=A0AAD3XI56_NEPGR|nr:hypothetical protein Nepgr_007283 [Nepenthes gracilis]
MNSKIYHIFNRLSSILQKSRHPSEALIVLGRRRLYHANGKEMATLYSKISPLGSPAISMKPELDDWVQKGKKVRVAELQRIIHDLRKRRRFSQALQISEWMNEKGICKFSPTEHAVQLDLIGRVHGFQSAESYFNDLTDQDRTQKTYGALLNCYVRQREINKSLSHFHKMKEMGFASSTITYNDVMCLYTYTDQHEKVPEVLAEMKQSKILPDNYSYRICINSYGVRSDLVGMEKILKEMEAQPHIVMEWNTYAVAANLYIKSGLTDKAIEALKKAEIRVDKKDSDSYNFLISLYARLGKKDEVLRLWELEKSACKKCINRDYVNMLKSLVRVAELEEAEKVLKEWLSSGNCYDFRVPNIVVAGYSEKLLFEKAEAVLRDLTERGKASAPSSWSIVAAGYLDKGEMRKAIGCMNAALSLHVEDKGWKPNCRVITSLLSWVGDEGSTEDAGAFVESLRTVIPVSSQMYQALIKANIRNGKDVHSLLGKMRAEKVEEDEETKKILSMRQ